MRDLSSWTRDELLLASVQMAETREFMKENGLDKISHVDWPDSPGGPPVIRPGSEPVFDPWRERIDEFRKMIDSMDTDYDPPRIIRGHV